MVGQALWSRALGRRTVSSVNPVSAPLLWAGADVRRRWRSLVVLGLLAGITAGLAMAAFAGARRTDTALARLDKVTNAPDAIIFASQVGDLHPEWSRLAARPEVAQLAVWELFFCNIYGQPGGLLFASAGDGWLSSIDKPVVLAGRMFNPKAADEVVVDDQFASAEKVRVGDVVPVQAYALDQPEATGTPHGPTMKLRVVGIVRTAEELLFVPGVLVSPGVVAKYRNQAVFDPNAVVRLKGGQAGMNALRRDVNSLVAPGVPVLDLHDTSRRVTTSLAVESFALYMIALALVLAGGLLVAQVLSRSSAFIGDDVASLRAMGMTRPQVACAATFSTCLAIGVALLVGLMAAVALSLAPSRHGSQRRPRHRGPRGLDGARGGSRPHRWSTLGWLHTARTGRLRPGCPQCPCSAFGRRRLDRSRGTGAGYDRGADGLGTGPRRPQHARPSRSHRCCSRRARRRRRPDNQRRHRSRPGQP